MVDILNRLLHAYRFSTSDDENTDLYYLKIRLAMKKDSDEDIRGDMTSKINKLSDCIVWVQNFENKVKFSTLKEILLFQINIPYVEFISDGICMRWLRNGVVCLMVFSIDIGVWEMYIILPNGNDELVKQINKFGSIIFMKWDNNNTIYRIFPQLSTDVSIYEYISKKDIALHKTFKDASWCRHYINSIADDITNKGESVKLDNIL